MLTSRGKRVPHIVGFDFRSAAPGRPDRILAYRQEKAKEGMRPESRPGLAFSVSI
ncbi:hypothetical protein [Aquibium oceanicum]|uniref:hypothetical protein n=1 Tax=Aquibium oceanicum TaxID=1670800 RepID=UPI000AEAECA7|nr:hypothetical protein [Aquibium oceanicum]